jgi:hypothetical protein
MNSQGIGQNGRNKKNKVVLKLKRKRENVPEETIVVEERAKKAPKLNFIEAFSKMGFEENQTKSKTLFRLLGSETDSNAFDLSAKLKEIRKSESEKLPVIYPKKQGVIFEEKKMKEKENKNTMPGLITNKEQAEGYEIIEINHSSLKSDDAHEYDYYYMDEVTNVEKFGGDVLIIQFESFFVNDEVDEYDQDDPLSGDEEEIDYPSSSNSEDGSINSWERGSSDDGAGPHGDVSSDDEYGDEYDY